MESKDHHTWKHLRTRREEISEVEVEGEYDSAFAPRQLQDSIVGQAMKPLLSKMKDQVTALAQLFRGAAGYPHIRQESHQLAIGRGWTSSFARAAAYCSA